MLLSNTQRLETLGWRGICVEPFPTNFENRTCKVERVAVAPHEGSAGFIRCSGWRSAISAFPNASGAASMKENRDESHCQEVGVPTKPLRQILAERGVPRIIDYVSLDIEGSELEVLTHFPFAEYCVRLWSVEHTSFQGAAPDKLAIKTLFDVQGCKVRQSFSDFLVDCRC
jgi:FkbM family methyltransferase